MSSNVNKILTDFSVGNYSTVTVRDIQVFAKSITDELLTPALEFSYKQDTEKIDECIRKLGQEKLRLNTIISVNENISIKREYIDELEKKEQKFEEEIKKLKIERLCKQYEILVQSCLKQEKYPISKDTKRKLRNFGTETLKLTLIALEEIEEKLEKSYYDEKLRRYEKEFFHKLRTQEGRVDYSDKELKKLKQGLLEEDIREVEKKSLEDYFQQQFSVFIEEYKSKLKEENYPLSSSSISYFESYKKKLISINKNKDKDIDKEIAKIIKPCYEERLSEYIAKRQSKHNSDSDLQVYNRYLNSPDIQVIQKLLEYDSDISYFLDRDQGYLDLRFYLDTGDLKKANDKTIEIISKQGDKKVYLNQEPLLRCDSKTLLTIDLLWSEYSDKKFGLSTQQQQFTENGSTESFERTTLLFDYNDAPDGHLPAWWDKNQVIITTNKSDYYKYVFNYIRIITEGVRDQLEREFLKRKDVTKDTRPLLLFMVLELLCDIALSSKKGFEAYELDDILKECIIVTSKDELKKALESQTKAILVADEKTAKSCQIVFDDIFSSVWKSLPKGAGAVFWFSPVTVIELTRKLGAPLVSLIKSLGINNIKLLKEQYNIEKTPDNEGYICLYSKKY